MAQALNKLVGFFRAGYPDGLPRTGYVPVFALLPRRPSAIQVDVAQRKHST